MTDETIIIPPNELLGLLTLVASTSAFVICQLEANLSSGDNENE